MAGFFSMEKDAIEDQIEKFSAFKHDEKKEKQAQLAVLALTRKIKATLVELSKIPVKGLFQGMNKDQEDLIDYLNFYKDETDELCRLISQLHPTYQQLSKLQNQLFKKQEELVASKLEKTKNDLRLQIAKMILDDPDCQADVDNLEKRSEKVPEEIKNELGQLRAKLVETVNQFKAHTTSANINKISQYQSLFDQANRRHEINEVSKELVNFSQGMDAIRGSRIFTFPGNESGTGRFVQSVAFNSNSSQNQVYPHG